jgi:NADH:ubiquinone oxidoreductase subunit E
MSEVTRFTHGSRVPGWDDAVDPDKAPSPVPDPATTPVPAELRAEIEAEMAKYPQFRSALIPALHAAQRLHGWCSPEAIEQVACVMRITPGEAAAVATFYDMFETKPVGSQTIYVCTNISCSLRGGDRILERMKAAADGDEDFNIRGFECLGACDMAPMASVNGEYVGPLDDGDCDLIIEQVRAGGEILPAKNLRNRECADPAGRAVGGNPTDGGES